MNKSNNEHVQDIIDQVKQVDNGVNGMIVPILKDTIKDTNVYNKRLFIICLIELFIILFATLFTGFLIYKQNIKYQEFLKQFEYETEVYQNTDDNSVINSGININK